MSQDNPKFNREQIIQLLNQIGEGIAHAKAASIVPIGCDMQNIKPETWHEYLGGLTNILAETGRKCENLIAKFYQLSAIAAAVPQTVSVEHE